MQVYLFLRNLLCKDCEISDYPLYKRGGFLKRAEREKENEQKQFLHGAVGLDTEVM